MDAQSSVATVGSGSWHLVVGRFITSTEVAIFLDGIWAKNTTSIAASIFNSSADLAMAAASGGTDLMDGKIALAFICAANVPDGAVERLWNVSRHIFGV